MSALELSAAVEQAAAVLWRVTWQAVPWTLGVWALVRLVPGLPASVRTTLWWLVGLKCLLVLGTLGPLRLPLLPAPPPPPASTSTSTSLDAPRVARPDTSRPPAGAAAPVAAPDMPWKEALVLLWLGGVAWRTGVLGRELVRLRRLRRDARPVEDGALTAALHRLARELGVSRPPRLLVSEQVPGPMVLGAWRPTILLPRRGVDTLSPREQHMALAHELAHVRRRDLWFGWVPALAQTLLFFHPLVRRACQEYALAREEACDALALRATGAEPHDYGRLLLLFGVARAPAAAAASGAPSHLAALKRRIAMLQHARTDSKHVPRWARWALGGLALVALAPIQVVAREAVIPEAPPPAAEPAAPAPALVVPTPPAVVPTAPGPKAPRPPAVPRTPAAPRPPPEVSADVDAENSYVFLGLSGQVTVSNADGDVEAAHALSAQDGKPLLYMRRGGKAFVIRDERTLEAVAKAFEPQKEIGRKQAEVGRKQAEIGRKMAELGQKQSAIGQKQSALGVKISQLAQKQANIAIERATQGGKRLESLPDLSGLEEEIEREMEPFEREMEKLGEEMEVFSEPMEKLGEEMEAASEPMEELGEQMEEASRQAEQKVRAQLDEAVRKGLAEPVKP